MFKNPFGFAGRIRRMEFGLSYIIYIAYIFVVALTLGILSGAGYITEQVSEILLPVAAIPAAVFLLAQGAKRCHDRGNSGFFQLIPLYVFWMLFADSEPETNEYGATRNCNRMLIFMSNLQIFNPGSTVCSDRPPA